MARAHSGKPPTPSPPLSFAKRGTGRLRLLNAAIKLFAARGFDGVAVDEVVAAAGVNKRMVYHYFGSKEELYRAALQHVFADLGTLEADVISTYDARKGPIEGMRRIMEVYFYFLEGHPEFVRLLLWENLSEGRHLEEIEHGLSKSPVLTHLTALLEEGVAAGCVRPGLDARLVLTSLIGLCLIYFSNRFTLSKSVGVNFTKTTSRRRASAHAADFFIAGLRV